MNIKLSLSEVLNLISKNKKQISEADAIIEFYIFKLKLLNTEL